MVLITTDGRKVHNNLFTSEGGRVRPGGSMYLTDGTHLITPVDHNIPNYEVTTTIQSYALQNSLISYNIELECTNDVDPGEALSVSVPIPAGFTLVLATTNEGTYNSTTELWSPTLTNSLATLNLILSCTTTGLQSQTVTLNDTGDTWTNTCTILASDSEGSLYYTDVPITNILTLANLQDGHTYTLLAYSYVNDTSITGIHDGVKNNRLSVINGDTIYGGRASDEGGYELVSCHFVYDSSETLTLRLYGEYQSVSTACTDRWAGLCLQEGLDLTYSPPGNLLSNPVNMLDDTSSATLTLPGGEESAEYTFNIPVSNLTNPLSFFTGIKLSVNSFGTQNSGIIAEIESSNGEISNTQSEYISRTGTVSFGGMTELWGLQSGDIEGKTLSIKVKFTNSTLTSQTFSYSNLTLTLYYIEDETGGAEGFTAKDIHSMNYQLLLLDVDIPEGPEREIGTVNFPLADGETIVNHSLKSKQIKATFVVWGDTLEEAKNKLRSINQWLTNERNSLSIPIPYDLIFDFEPDMAYQVILGEPMDTQINYTSIECDITFTVEKGVALTTETKITGPVGTNEGLIKVKPVITLLTDGSASITVTDTISNQMVKINTTIASDTVVTIDCENNTVVDSAGTDYSTDVDVQTVWFNFFNEYSLTCTGGVVQSVSYQEGF